MADETHSDAAQPDDGNNRRDQDGRANGSSYGSDERGSILAQLSEGASLSAICRADGMPSRETVRQWQLSDSGFDLAVTHAREEGYHALAEKALADAETETDAVKGRLKFDARRWYLGKLSNAFSDNKPQKAEFTGKVIHAVEIEFVNKAEG